MAMEANKIAVRVPAYRAQRFLSDVRDTDFHLLRGTVYSQMAFWALYLSTVVLTVAKNEDVELLTGYAQNLRLTRWVEVKAVLSDYFYFAPLFDAPCMKTWAQIGTHA